MVKILFPTIQFNLSFVSKQSKYQTVLFDLRIGPFQVLPLRIRVDLGAIAIKRYISFPKAPELEAHH